jgi:hypothetical protein
MVAQLKHIGLVVAAMLLLNACDNGQTGAKAPIILGDSSTIVTEADAQQLKDLVTDLQPVIPAAEDKDEDPNAAPPADTAKAAAAEKPTEQKPQALPTGPGLKAEFSEVTVMIPGLDVKQAGKPDLHKAHGVTYSLKDGEINGATMHVKGDIVKVSQRYQSVVVMKSEYGDLVLDNLSITAGWKEIKGSNNTYPIKNLDAKSLDAYDADASDIRKAIQKAGRRYRLSRSKVQDLENSVRRVRSVNQKPFSVTYRSVMWKIDGKDTDGKFYSKQIRIDVPM